MLTGETPESEFRSSLKTSFDPTRGITTTEVWKMAGGDGLTGLAAKYRALGYQFELDSNPHISTLTVTSPTPQGGEPDVQTDQWQMMCNEINIELYEYAFSLGLSITELATVKRGVADNAEGSTVDTTSWTANMVQLFKMKIKGVDFVHAGEHVLRHSTNVSANYTNNVSDNNINCIYTNSQLKNEITNGNYWTYPAPARIWTIVMNRPSGDTNGGDLRWGWRKLPSNETTAPNNRIEITTEYWFAGYPYFLYADAVAV